MKLLNALVLSALFMFCAPASAEKLNSAYTWTLDAEKSRVNFVSIKKGNIAESHTFSDISGHVTDGKARVIIKPDSVDSRIPIRDERMREFLFETGVYPTIEIVAEVSAALKGLEPGNSSLASIPATLSLHGETKELTLDVRISRLNQNTMVVASTQPVLVRAANFNMVDGIIKLSSLVNNLPIAETVPVSFSLLLKNDHNK